MSSYIPSLSMGVTPETSSYRGRQAVGAIARTALTQADLQRFHAELTRSRRQLVAQIAELQKLAMGSAEGQDSTASGYPGVPVTADARMWAQLMALRDIDNKRSLLRQIDAALERMAQNRYGLCVVDQAPIPKEVLEELPWASRCAHCAGKE